MISCLPLAGLDSAGDDNDRMFFKSWLGDWHLSTDSSLGLILLCLLGLRDKISCLVEFFDISKLNIPCFNKSGVSVEYSSFNLFSNLFKLKDDLQIYFRSDLFDSGIKFFILVDDL